MNEFSGRVRREQNTIDAMIRLYCRLEHKSAAGLCGDCSDLRDYARARLERCPYAPEKPTCANCPVHCYRPDMRERIRAVMRFSGPRMLVHHPWLAVRHLLDGRKKAVKKISRLN